jgi:hypothetical protein
VKQVVVMGGAFGVNGHRGNVTPYAEANIHDDPDAADRVFTAPWPLVIIGLDVTQQSIFTAPIWMPCGTMRRAGPLPVGCQPLLPALLFRAHRHGGAMCTIPPPSPA